MERSFFLFKVLLVLLICASVMGSGIRPLTVDEIRQLKESGVLSMLNSIEGLPPTNPTFKHLHDEDSSSLESHYSHDHEEITTTEGKRKARCFFSSPSVPQSPMRIPGSGIDPRLHGRPPHQFPNQPLLQSNIGHYQY